MIVPPAALGVLGGGQLGRMFAMAARSLGYGVVVLDPDPDAPAGALADAHLVAAYDDPAALAELAARCAAVTTEFENPPAAALDLLAAQVVVAPSARAVAIAQDRIAEKSFLAAAGVPVGPWAAVADESALDAAVALTGLPAILKTARLGYDGKGQRVVASVDELRRSFLELGGVPCVLEAALGLQAELSVVAARTATGEVVAFPVGENRHVNGILDTTVVPARVDAALTDDAVEIATTVAEALAYRGVLAVELFVVDGRLLVNEIAPRPHNSGHWTLDACRTSQFEQQVRAVCGLPLGEPGLSSPVAMLNVLGDAWSVGAPPWPDVLRVPGTKVHLYGKAEPRPGRKMGHVTVVAESIDVAVARLDDVRALLSRGRRRGG